MNRQVAAYVSACDTCQRVKFRRDRPAGLLQPLPIPDRKWQSVSMDYIVELPRTSSGHDAILVFVDRLTKMVHLVATTSEVTAEETAELFVRHVVRLHGTPDELISDRDRRFSSRFFKQLMQLLGVHQRMSTAFHPQTDGQTEVMNRTVEDYLRSFVGPVHDNWDDRLSLAEFAMNNSKSASTGASPFFLNYGEHPRSPHVHGLPSWSSEEPPPTIQGYDPIGDRIPAVRRIARDAVIFAVQEYFIDNGSVRQWLMEYNDCTQALCIICQNPHGRDRHIGIDS